MRWSLGQTPVVAWATWHAPSSQSESQQPGLAILAQTPPPDGVAVAQNSLAPAEYEKLPLSLSVLTPLLPHSLASLILALCHTHCHCPTSASRLVFLRWIHHHKPIANTPTYYPSLLGHCPPIIQLSLQIPIPTPPTPRFDSIHSSRSTFNKPQHERTESVSQSVKYRQTTVLGSIVSLVSFFVFFFVGTVPPQPFPDRLSDLCLTLYLFFFFFFIILFSPHPISTYQYPNSHLVKAQSKHPTAVPFTWHLLPPWSWFLVWFALIPKLPESKSSGPFPHPTHAISI